MYTVAYHETCPMPPAFNTEALAIMYAINELMNGEIALYVMENGSAIWHLEIGDSIGKIELRYLR